MDDFENFEFIDYTTSGPWERFITQIEDSLRSWGLVNQSLGVFDPSTAPEPEPKKEAYKHNAPDVDSSRRQSTSSERVYQLKEMLSLDDATYAFSYHYHPAMAKLASGLVGVDLEFLPTKLDGVHHHSLHRWTALTHFLVISPVTISDIFASSMTSASSAIIDLSSAKLLLSSFAIAFQNTGCNIPVFVPTGQPWNLTFTGLSIQPELFQQQQARLEADLEIEDDDQGIEVRFNTVLVPYPPVQQTFLPGILDFFIHRMSIEDPEPVGSSGGHSQALKSLVQVSALFSYDLVNWYDEDWRRWRATSDYVGNGLQARGTKDRVGQEVSDDAAMNMDDIKSESRSTPLTQTPALPFGPVQDPLESLRLYARFASAPSNVYLDNRDFSDMDACNANIWVISATFKSDDAGILSGILEETISSWSSETSKTSYRGSNGGSGGQSDRDLAYGVLLNKGARLIHGTITMVDTVDVDNIIDTLFEQSLDHTASTTSAFSESQPSPTKLDKKGRPYTATELGFLFRHATTVPYNSFLWKMVQHLLDVISPNSDISYATSVMGFLKVLWSELLKKLYQHWEESRLIPLVDIYGEGYNHQMRTNSGPTEDEQERKPVAIDLRYNLLHQKLSMLNCCIARQIARNKDTASHIHPVKKYPKDRQETPVSSPVATNNSSPWTASSEPQTYGAQLHSLLHGLSDISRPKSADVVPLAKKFMENVKRRGGVGIPSQADESPALSRHESQTEPSSPVPVQIPGEQTSRSRRSRGGDNIDLQVSATSMDHSDGDDGEEDVFYDPLEYSETPSHMSDPPYLQRRTHSLTESYVALRYSSSVDSQSGVLVDDLDQTSVLAHGPDPREVTDMKSEGGLRPLKDLKLLDTGAPLMIPKLQEPGYMTEDMIQQQEELFETLGTSSDGAKMRAKMQSTQLISDMEAFKAANPGCVLGDFIRWHSPKDWVEDKCQMSARMADAGNYWQELWANSKRIPVSRQTPLFNHNQEAAKVLFFMDGLSGDQLFLQFLPTMCLLAYDALVSHPVVGHIRKVAMELKDLGNQLALFPWNNLTSEDDMHLEQVVERFRQVELLMGRAIALVRKFPDQYDLVERILEREETVVEDGPERESVYDLFCVGGSPLSSFPQPTSKEFVLQTLDPLPEPFSKRATDDWDSRPMARRMYACFKESEARIVESIAKDGVYM
ncbi:MAG: Rab3 GTPase-activating protein catalytic subunit-domain-containing protein [Podila humilis]|nr:MAG: Rab3 GTPase-activating protein catalytic subunit-domain-containing protein [Podila humilis]